METKISYRPSPKALLNPCSDRIFKKLFTDDSEESRQALQSFLETIIGKPISNIVLQPNEVPIENSQDKNSRFDLNCKIDGTEYANIEMQGINKECAYEKRAEYHCAHLLNHHVPKGKNWTDVPKVYQISVLNFVREKESEREVFYYKFRTEDGYTLHDRQNIFFIELPKVKKIVEAIEDKSLQIKDLTTTQKWCIFFLYAPKEEYEWLVKEIAREERGIMCVVEVLDKISQDEIMWKKEFDEFVIETDRRTTQAFYYNKGKTEGIEQGIEQGVEQEKLETAKRLLEMGLSFKQVSQGTGLSIETLEKLKH